MADVAVTSTNVVSLSKDTRAALPAGQSVATGDTAVLTPAAGAPFKGRYMLIKATPGASSTLTVKAGVVGTPASQAKLGDLTVGAFTADSVIQVDLSRYLQANGTVRIVVGGTGPVVFSVLNLTKGV